MLRMPASADSMLTGWMKSKRCSMDTPAFQKSQLGIKLLNIISDYKA